MQRMRTFAIWVLLIACVIGVYGLVHSDSVPEGTSEQFVRDAQTGDVVRVEVRSGAYRVYTDAGTAYDLDVYTLSPDAYEVLRTGGIPISTNTEESGPIEQLLPILVVGIGVVLLLGYGLRRMASANTRGIDIAALRKTRARLVENPPATRFADVGGCEEAKERLADLVDFLRNPQLWAASGARVPRGVLLEGPPGSGKTLLARAVAGEAGVRFFECAGSEFVELMVGVGAARVRDLFENAAKSAPALIFIDELDSLGRRRGSGLQWSNEEREQTLNQILVALDGFQPSDRVVVIGATNRSDILDPALVRPGRFDTRLVLPPLDVAAREQVLRIHTRGKPHGLLDLGAWARKMAGASGARVEQVVNEAALRAVRRRGERGGTIEITDADLADAWQAVADGSQGFGPFEQAIVTSSWQLVRPESQCRAKVVLTDGRAIEGTLTWADGSHLELLREEGSRIVIAKAQVVTMET